MCLVSEQLREAVKQRLAVAADEIFELLERTMSEYKEETQRHALEQLLNTRGQGLKTEYEEEVKTEETWTPLLPHNHTQNQTHNQNHTQDNHTPQLHHTHEQTPTYSKSHSHNQTQDWPESTHNLNHNQNHSQTHNHSSTQDQTPALPHNHICNQKHNQLHSHTYSQSQPQDSTPQCQALEQQTLGWIEAATPLSPPGGALRHFCSICAKGFRAEWQLKRHMRVHTGERPFSCSVCGRSFSRKDALRGHVAIHTGRTLSGAGTKTCQICGKIFRSANHLRRHMTVHTGEKPFSCSVCGRSFSRGESLRKHMDAHTARNECCTTNQPPGGSKTQTLSSVSPHHTIPPTPQTV
ncbi:zinc finger protein 90 homolog isoform X1 [Boleophthalmus pectinirostris]|uniref:zinc finger protein 90 homolog isoform X1 n=2 Tax=Boleophthalmus pectinirostris TaxID=150288 RepID=UPI00242A6C84|nr:zinc finger protein 90 homolog isoform X1 [Boleophthalmus pectinirostris]